MRWEGPTLIDVEQGTPEWDALRLSIPTASEFGRIITSEGKASTQIDTYAARLAADAFAGAAVDHWAGNRSTERGHELEDEARLAYEFLNDIEVTRIGFVMNSGAGASPDGLIGDDGLHEIKCLEAAAHVQAIAYWQKHRRCPSKYIPQVQGQMLICDRDWCDLTLFHPELPELTIRVRRDGAFLEKLAGRISTCIEKRDAYLEALRAAS